MKNKVPVHASLVALALLALIAAPPILGHEVVPTAEAQIYKPHGPIKITHNNDFRAPENGVSGHGTSSSPYIIEGFEFTANTSTGDATAPAIWITGTSAHFVIRNCRFDLGADRVAIRLDDMSNGVVADNSFLGNKIAMQFTRTGAVTVLNNKIDASTQAGMVMIETGTTQIRKNTFTGNGADIQLNTTDKGQIVENVFNVKNVGIDFSDGANFKVNGNTFTAAAGAIGARIAGMDGGEIKENKFTGFTQWGLQILRSNKAIIQNNEFTDNGLNGQGGGVGAEESSSLQLLGNKANNNKGRGVYLLMSSQSWIKDGEANNNANDGIELRYSGQNGIRNMQANDNGRAGINLNESGGNLVDLNFVLRNKVRDNGSLIVGGNDNKVTKNEVANNQGFGILITQWMSGNQIVANNLHDNRLEDFYTDSDPNANIYSREEIKELDTGGGKGGFAPGLPVVFAILALLGLAVARRRRD